MVNKRANWKSHSDPFLYFLTTYKIIAMKSSHKMYYKPMNSRVERKKPQKQIIRRQIKVLQTNFSIGCKSYRKKFVLHCLRATNQYEECASNSWVFVFVFLVFCLRNTWKFLKLNANHSHWVDLFIYFSYLVSTSQFCTSFGCWLIETETAVNWFCWMVLVLFCLVKQSAKVSIRNNQSLIVAKVF